MVSLFRRRTDWRIRVMRLDYEMAYNKAVLSDKALSNYNVDELVGYYMSKGVNWVHVLDEDVLEYSVSSVRAQSAKSILTCLNLGGE